MAIKAKGGIIGVCVHTHTIVPIAVVTAID